MVVPALDDIGKIDWVAQLLPRVPLPIRARLLNEAAAPDVLVSRLTEGDERLEHIVLDRLGLDGSAWQADLEVVSLLLAFEWPSKEEVAWVAAEADVSVAAVQ